MMRPFRYMTCLLLALSVGAIEMAAAGDRRQTVVTSADYVMADTDTLATAERAAILRAQRKAVEQSGVYIESTFQDVAWNSGAQSSQTSSLTIRTITAAVVATEILEQRRAFEDDRPRFMVTIRAVVDLERLEEAVRRLQREKLLTEHFRQLQAENASLKNAMVQLRRKIEHGATLHNPASIVASTELIDGAIRTAAWSEKIALTSRAIAANPRESTAFIVRGQTYLHLASLPGTHDADHQDQTWFLQRALMDFSQAVALNRTNTWALFGRADVMIKLGRAADALQDYHDLLHIDPLFDTARERMTALAIEQARAEIKHQHWQQALAPLDLLLGDAPLPVWVPLQAEAYLFRSRIHLALNQLPAALGDLNTLLAAVPDHRDGRVERGRIYRKLGQKLKAEDDFHLACELGARQVCGSS